MRNIFLLLLFSTSLSAQQLKVLDLETQKPIPNLYIYCENHSAVTNSKGEVAIVDFFKCKNINFQHPAYTFVSFTPDQIKSKNYIIYLEETPLSLIEVPITYNNWEQSAREVPIRIANISKKDIDFQNPQTTADLLGQSGKVFIQKSQLGGGSPMIRGFSTSRVLLVVDGVRMNTAIFREGNVQNVISLDANSIDKSEVIFGPGSVVYGSDAIGGVMDFHTLQPQYSFSDDARFSLNYLARYNSANFEKTAHVDFNIGTEKFASLTSVSFSDYDDQIMGSQGPDEYLRNHYQARINGKDSTVESNNPLEQTGTGFSQFNLMQKLRFRLKKDSELNYGFHYSISSDVPRYDRLIEYDGVDTLRNAEWYYGPQVWIMNNLNYSNNKSNAFFDRFKLTAAHQYFEESRNDRRSFSENLRSRTEKVQALSFSSDLEKNLNSKLELFYGLEYVHNLIGSEGVIQNISTLDETATSTRYPDGSTWSYGSLYSAIKYKINKRTTLSSGLRANYVGLKGNIDTSFFPFSFTSINNDFFALNGSAGLAYLPSETWQVNVNLSNGFRAPNIDDVSKIFDSSPGVVVVPNADLQPEFLYSLDLGIIKRSDWYQLELSGFYSFLDQALIRQEFSVDGQDSIFYDGVLSQVQAIQNAESATVWGIQGGFKFNYRSYQLKSSLHYNYGRNSDNEPLRHVAPLFGSTHLIYQKEKTTIDLFSIYNGSISAENLAPSEIEKPHLYALDNDGNPYSPSWVTFNLRIEQKLSKNISMQIGLENLTDLRYRPYSSGIASMGRSISLGIRGKI